MQSLKQLLIISGYSGAGKSVALRALEDVGYTAIDNIPLKQMAAVIESSIEEAPRMAVGCDIRSHGFSPSAFLEIIAQLRHREDLQVQLVFLSCDANTLLRRFKETRRPHPMAKDRPLLNGIHSETILMEPILEAADTVIDTSNTIARELQRLFQERYEQRDYAFAVEFVSFSYKRGIPQEADLVFDVRFLNNPHYEATLRPLTGHDHAVGNYVQQDKRFVPFITKLSGFLQGLVPYYQEEGKRQLIVAIGCTGGKHRSVFVTNHLHAHFLQEDIKSTARHREYPAKHTAEMSVTPLSDEQKTH